MLQRLTNAKVLIGAIIIMVILILISQHAFATSNPHGDKLNICHKTGSVTNPWVVQQVHANELQSHLDNGDLLYEGPLKPNGHPDQKAGKAWCAEHGTQPSVTPSLTPTPTGEPDETVTPTETPEVTPPVICRECNEVTPTATPTPTPTDSPVGNTGSTTTSSTTPVCSDGNTVQLPANPHVIRQGSEATVNFFVTEGDSANIYVRVSGTSWAEAVTAARDVKPNSEHFVSYVFHNLQPTTDYDFAVQQKTGCGSGQLVLAVIHDGASSGTLFPFSWWEWAQ